jgi:hypothetical protein
MPKDTYVKHKQNSTSIRFGELKAPLQKKAMELDRSLNWLVCKCCKEHPDMKLLIDELNKTNETKRKTSLY